MDVPLPDYPQPFGTRKICVTTHQGPANYQAGGELVTASTFGFGSFDAVRVSMSFNKNNTATYIVRANVPVAQSPIVSNNNIQGNIPTGANNVTLQWITTSTGNEVANNTNLSSEFCRVEYIGG